MIFMLVLIVATLVAAIIQRGSAVRSWARWGLAVALIVAGVAHLADPTPFEQHLPGWVPGATGLVLVTGLIEIGLGAALAWSQRRREVGAVVAVYLVGVFPANVYVAVAGVDVDGQPGGVYPWIRLPFQALFVAWALWSTRAEAGVHTPNPEIGNGVGDLTAHRRHGPAAHAAANASR